MGLALTGIGMISEFASGLDELYDAVINGKIHHTDAAVPKLKEKGLVFTDSITRKAYAAIKAAEADSGMKCRDRDDMGIFLGTAFGSLASMEKFGRTAMEKGMRGIMPMDFINSVMNAPAGQLAILCGLSGINITVSDGSASSLGALRMCRDMIAEGRVSAAAVGGIEERCGLYDEYIKQNGGEPSEGVCMFIAEDAAAARARKAHIYAELLGSAYKYAERYVADDIFEIMSEAVRDAGIDFSDIDFIITRGAGDNEMKAIHKTGTKAIDIKDATGETYGAGGAFKTAAAIALFERNEADAVMVNSFGFDGFMGCCVLKRGGVKTNG